MTNSLPNQTIAPAPLRLGAISFVNTIPIYYNYRPDASTQLIYDVPARLNAQLLAGELDISPISSACYLRNPDKLVLLDNLSVSSHGAVESVIFLSKQPLGPALLEASQISIPNDSETSVALLAYLLADTLQNEAQLQACLERFTVYEAQAYQEALDKTGNALIIGDNALLIQQAGLSAEYYCYDLSSLWQARTGLPFVFAVWAANREWAEAHPERLQGINQQLCQSKERFYNDAESFQAALNLAQRKSQLPEATLIRYYRHCLNYDLTAQHQESLTRFAETLEKPAQAVESPSASNEELCV